MEEFVITQEMEDKLKQAQTVEEVVEILAAEGIEVSAEELKAVLEGPVVDENGQISEAALDNVTGGALWLWKLLPLLPKLLPKPRPIVPFWR